MRAHEVSEHGYIRGLAHCSLVTRKFWSSNRENVWKWNV